MQFDWLWVNALIVIVSARWRGALARRHDDTRRPSCRTHGELCEGGRRHPRRDAGGRDAHGRAPATQPPTDRPRAPGAYNEQDPRQAGHEDDWPRASEAPHVLARRIRHMSGLMVPPIPVAAAREEEDATFETTWLCVKEVTHGRSSKIQFYC